MKWSRSSLRNFNVDHYWSEDNDGEGHCDDDGGGDESGADYGSNNNGVNNIIHADNHMDEPDFQVGNNGDWNNDQMKCQNVGDHNEPNLFLHHFLGFKPANGFSAALLTRLCRRNDMELHSDRIARTRNSQEDAIDVIQQLGNARDITH